MLTSLKLDGTRKGKLVGTAGQKGGMFRESTGPVVNIPSDAPLGGTRKWPEQGVPARRAEYSSAVRLRIICDHCQELRFSTLFHNTVTAPKCSQ
jgi:hypothetical protein